MLRALCSGASDRFGAEAVVIPMFQEIRYGCEILYQP
jgi:hypothetical protein